MRNEESHSSHSGFLSPHHESVSNLSDRCTYEVAALLEYMEVGQ